MWAGSGWDTEQGERGCFELDCCPLGGMAKLHGRRSFFSWGMGGSVGKFIEECLKFGLLSSSQSGVTGAAAAVSQSASNDGCRGELNAGWVSLREREDGDGDFLSVMFSLFQTLEQVDEVGLDSPPCFFTDRDL